MDTLLGPDGLFTQQTAFTWSRFSMAALYLPNPENNLGPWDPWHLDAPLGQGEIVDN